jgi:hypothetical protein
VMLGARLATAGAAKIMARATAHRASGDTRNPSCDIESTSSRE